MRTTLLNGAQAGDLFVDELQDLLIGELNTYGWQVDAWTLCQEKISYCLGCFECWLKTPGLCRIDDAGRAVAASVINSQMAIFLTPVTFGSYSSELKKAVDRLIPLISPFFTHINGEVHHRRRYAHYPALVAVGVLPEPDTSQEEILMTMTGRNALNFHAPLHASYFVYRSNGAESAQGTVRSIAALGKRIVA